MPTGLQRAIVYVLVVPFCVVGPAFLLIALGAAIKQVRFVRSALHAEGTVIALQEFRNTRSTTRNFVPVFQFTAGNGQSYVVRSRTAARQNQIRIGDRVEVLYSRLHPESAFINRFGQLWTFPLVFGAIGAAFSTVPAFVLFQIRRRRNIAASFTLFSGT
jgi:hypothetical protein